VEKVFSTDEKCIKFQVDHNVSEVSLASTCKGMFLSNYWYLIVLEAPVVSDQKIPKFSVSHVEVYRQDT
jgi:hypothetical protein